MTKEIIVTKRNYYEPRYIDRDPMADSTRPHEDLVYSLLCQSQNVSMARGLRCPQAAARVLMKLYKKQLRPYTLVGIHASIAILEEKGRIQFGLIGYCKQRKARTGFFIVPPNQANEKPEATAPTPPSPQQAQTRPSIFD